MSGVATTRFDRATFRTFLALLIVAAAYLLRLALVLRFRLEMPPFITFYPAVMIVAMFFGFRRGALATVLAALLTVSWTFPSLGQFTLGGTSDAISLAVFVCLGLFMSVLAGRYRRYQRRVATFEKAQALGEIEERFRALVTASTDVVYRMSPDWSEMRQLYGRDFIADTDAPSGNWLERYIHPDDQPRVTAAIAEAIRTRSKFELEHRVLQVDGSLGWTFSHAIPLMDAKGEIVEWLGTASDVTGRKTAEEKEQRLLTAAQQERDRLTALINSINDEVWFADTRARFTLVNPAGLREFGYTHGVEIGVMELLERSEVYRPDGTIRPFREAPPLRALSGETVKDLEEIVRIPATGLLRHRLVSAAPVRDAAGNIIGSVSVVRDITDRKRASEVLRSSQERLSAIISSAMDAIISIGQDQRILVFNGAAEKIFGCKASEAIGQPLDRFIPTAGRDAHRRHIQRFAESGTTSRSMTSPGVLSGLRANGEEFPIEATISQVTVGGEGLYTVILRDITERKRVEQALIRSEKLASVGRMAATVAHEINNPLAAVTNILYLVQGLKDLPPGAREYLDMVDAELKRVAHITRQSLGFYRESETAARVSVKAVLESAVDLMRSKIKQKRAVIEKDWDHDVEVMALAGELRQVFSNLIANGLDAIDEGGTIKLRIYAGTSFEDGRRAVRAVIADNGRGIDPVSRKQIFEPFFTTKGAVGTGLGLWVTKQIIDKHHGTIRMRSSTGGVWRGTVFSVALLVDAADSTQA